MIIDYQGQKSKLPDFLIAGAARSGTTSLHYYLKDHPQIFMPQQKELYFFCFKDAVSDSAFTHGSFPRGAILYHFDEYRNQFKNAKDNQMIGEACPWYLYRYGKTIENIKTVYKEGCKDLKIIIMLRNPAERAWSNFMMHRKDNIEPLSDFQEACKPSVIQQRIRDNWSISFDYIRWGLYYEQVKAFMEEFKNVKILLYEELCNDPLRVVKEIYSFIGVDTGFVPNVKIRHNVAGVVKSKWLNALMTGNYPMKGFLKSFIPQMMRKRLKVNVDSKNIDIVSMPDYIKKRLINDYYKGDILKLERLIERDLSSWHKV